MFGFFKRRENVFSKLIEEQASLSYEGLILLVKYLKTQDHEIAEQLALKEKEADEIRRILIDELNCSFVTPFDSTAFRLNSVQPSSSSAHPFSGFR